MSTLHSFFKAWPNSTGINQISLIHLSADGYFGYFHFLVVLNDAAGNIREQLFVWPCFHSPWVHRKCAEDEGREAHTWCWRSAETPLTPADALSITGTLVPPSPSYDEGSRPGGMEDLAPTRKVELHSFKTLRAGGAGAGNWSRAGPVAGELESPANCTAHP